MPMKRSTIEKEALTSLRKIVIAHDDLKGEGMVRVKAARKLPLIMMRARRLVLEMGPLTTSY